MPLSAKGGRQYKKVHTFRAEKVILNREKGIAFGKDEERVSDKVMQLYRTP